MEFTSIETAEPLWQETGYGDAFETARHFAGGDGFCFLDSAMRHDRLGRYSFICADPVTWLKPEPGEAAAALLGRIAALLDGFRLRHLPELPPFQGGLAGYLAYEFGRLIEPQLAAKTPAPDLPEAALAVYDCLIAFDHGLGRAFLVSTGFPETGAARIERAQARMREFAAKLAAPLRPLTGHGRIPAWSSNFTRPAYEAALRRTIDLILDGDIFQANIAQRFASPMPEGFDPLVFYAALRERNAAPFSAYLQSGDAVIASSSPERLLSYDGLTVEARPIKGTRRRDPDPKVDAALKSDLLASRKDRAENVMIVDLLRNDLSRVCDPGSVDVPVLCGLESYATVHHLTSAVTGRLSRGKSLPDLIGACFPGGSITGAPKLRAMEIIGEIEAVARNIYCGSIGYLGFSGRMDFNICIRTVLFHQGMAVVQGGGGITAKSDPAAEYDETLTKISRILQIFGAEPPA